MPDLHALDGDSLRRGGERALEMLAAYWSSVQATEPGFPVGSTAKPGEMYRRFAGPAPESGRAMEEVLGGLVPGLMGGLTHWQSPRFAAFFPANTSAPAVVGDLLSSGLGVQGMLWATSPACTELEMLVTDQLARIIGLPEAFCFGQTGRALEAAAEARPFEGNGGGVIQSTASDAAVVAMVAARHRLRRLDGGREGRLVVYASRQAHSSITKAAVVTGIADGVDDQRHVRLVDTDGALRMDAGALLAAMREDVAAGRRPALVCATLGTTSTCAVDDLEAIGAAVRAFDGATRRVWLHADAAFAGAAWVCPEHRWMLRGVEHADSLCFNPHKWLLTGFDCDVMWTQDRASLTGALSINPAYLQTSAAEAGAVFDYRDWQVPLGRRFRALKLYLVLQCFGTEGLRRYIRGHVEIAQRLEGLIAADGRFDLADRRLTGGGLSLLCLRLKGSDEANRRLVALANAEGRTFLGTTVAPWPLTDGPKAGTPAAVIRLALGSTSLTWAHAEAVWEAVRRAADRVTAEA